MIIGIFLIVTSSQFSFKFYMKLEDCVKDLKVMVKFEIFDNDNDIMSKDAHLIE